MRIGHLQLRRKPGQAVVLTYPDGTHVRVIVDDFEDGEADGALLVKLRFEAPLCVVIEREELCDE